MASFLDNPNIQFSNYINPINTQTYGAAITQKQQQYDQGLEKVQGVISSVAGLEVYRDVDKQYLQNKVNSLTGSLNKISGADWSNPQLIGQVGAYASQIAGDKQIENAVASTQRIKQSLSDMKDANKKGDSNPANQIYLQDQITAYNNNTDPDATFNGSYVPYYDLNKKFIELYNASAAHPDERITQDVMSYDAQGNPTVNMAAAEKSFKGVTPDRVNAIWQMVLADGGAQSQLRVNAHSTYRGMDGNAMLANLKQSADETVLKYNKQIDELKIDQSVNKNLKPEEVAAKIAQLETLGQNQMQAYRNMESLFQAGGKEALQTELYKANYGRNVINAFSYGQESTKYVKNELFQGKLDWLNYDLNRNKEAFNQQMATLNYEQRERALQMKGAKWGINPDTGEMELTGGGGDGLDISYQDAPLAQEQGEAGKVQFVKKLDGVKAQIETESRQHVNTICAASGINSPFVMRGGKLDWNVGDGPGQYRNYDAAKAAYDNIYTKSWNAYVHGNPKEEIRAFGDGIQPLRQRQIMMENQMANIERNYAGKEVDASHRIPTLGLIDWEPARQLRKAASEYIFGKNPQIMDSDLNEKRNAEYANLMKTNVPRDAHITAITPKDKLLLHGRMQSFAGKFATSRGNDILDAVNANSDKKPNTYFVRTEGDGSKSMIVRSAGGDEVKAPITDAEIARYFPQMQTSETPFRRQFGEVMTAAGGMTTDVGPGNILNRGGLANAYALPAKAGSKYRINFHWINKGDDTYMMKTWIRDNSTGQLIVNGDMMSLSENHWMDEAQASKMMAAMTDDNVVTGLLNRKNR